MHMKSTMLPPDDHAYLAERFPRFTETVESGTLCVVLPEFSLPDGLTPARADLLLRLDSGYPEVRPDMWWFDPAALRTDGNPIRATQATEQYLGKPWQRWSRHLEPNQWRPGIDSLQTFVALVKKELLSAAS